MKILFVSLLCSFSLHATLSETVRSVTTSPLLKERTLPPCNSIYTQMTKGSCSEKLINLCQSKVSEKKISESDYDRVAHESMADWLLAEIKDNSRISDPRNFITVAFEAGKLGDFSVERKRRKEKLIQKDVEAFQIGFDKIKSYAISTLEQHASISDMDKKDIRKYIHSIDAVITDEDLKKVPEENREMIWALRVLSCSVEGDIENAFFYGTGEKNNPRHYIGICPAMLAKHGKSGDPNNWKNLLFTVAHEIGHIISRVSKKSHNDFAFCMKSLKINSQLKDRDDSNWFQRIFLEDRFDNHREEIMSDYWGYQIFAKALFSENIDTMSTGDELLSKNLNILCLVNGSDGVHPASNYRYQISEYADIMRRFLGCEGVREKECELP